MTETAKGSLFLEAEVESYARAWQHLLETRPNTLADMLASSVKELQPNNPTDIERAKEFLLQYPPQPPPVKTAAQVRTKPVNFQFDGCYYDKGIDEKPISSWASCWLKFVYVLKDTVSDRLRFRGVLSYRLPNLSPFWEDPSRWKVSPHLIKGTAIYVYQYAPAKNIKEEMKVLAEFFEYPPPIIKEVDKLQNIKLDPT